VFVPAEDFVLFALGVHGIVIAATLVLARRPSACGAVAFLGAAVAVVFTTATATAVLTSSAPVGGILFTHAASGVVLDYLVTPLSAWFLVIVGVVSIPVAVYSIGYLPHTVPPSRIAAVGATFNVLLATVELVLVANNVIGFLFAWELMTLATAALVATEHEAGVSRRAAYLYLVMSHVGTGALVAGFFTLSSFARSLSFADIFTGAVVSDPLRHILFVLFLGGFGVKAGIVPFHVWLPEAHPAAPSSISALMSAVLIKAGVYGLFRVCAFGLGTPHMNWGLLCMGLGALSAILGVLYALAQRDVKRLLAYSTIENSGIILLGLGAGMVMIANGQNSFAVVAVAASLYHALNHAAFKGLLFLGAGGVVMATGTRRIEEFGGLVRRMPFSAFLFVIGALAISSIPPFNGFASEWLTLQALLLGFESVPGLVRVNFPVAGALLALTSALAAACFVKAFGITFLALPRSRAAVEAHEIPNLMLLPQAFLASVCLALGLVPGLVLSVAGAVTASLPGLSSSASVALGGLGLRTGPDIAATVIPSALGLTVLAAVAIAVAVVGVFRLGRIVRRVPTWGCGGALTPVTEYTGTAFSKPLLMIFRAVYRPTREVEALAEVSPYFPQEVRYRVEIEATFERYLYRPLTRAVIEVAERMKVLQAGSLHAYLGYVLVLGLILLIWLGGR